jgi:hypothetical protein
MKKNGFIHTTALALLAFGALHAPAGLAQERREFHGEREHFRSPHWVYDDRYRHGHFYPAPGYAIAALPTGNISVAFGGGRFFFHAGVWYRPSGPSFVVVRPPVGVIVPVLPPYYTVVYAGGVPYYYANEVYYTQAPGGYAVAAPPPGVESGPATAAPPPVAAPQPGPSAVAPAPAGTWYYCDSSKGYYPYVAECKEGWRAVPATPPSR